MTLLLEIIRGWKLYVNFDDNRGTSLVMIHSKSIKDIENKKDNFRFLEINNDKAIQYHSSAIGSSHVPNKCIAFYKEFQ